MKLVCGGMIIFNSRGSHGMFFMPWALSGSYKPTAQKSCRGYPLLESGAFDSIEKPPAPLWTGAPNPSDLRISCGDGAPVAEQINSVNRRTETGTGKRICEAI